MSLKQTLYVYIFTSGWINFSVDDKTHVLQYLKNVFISESWTIMDLNLNGNDEIRHFSFILMFNSSIIIWIRRSLVFPFHVYMLCSWAWWLVFDKSPSYMIIFIALLLLFWPLFVDICFACVFLTKFDRNHNNFISECIKITTQMHFLRNYFHSY